MAVDVRKLQARYSQLLSERSGWDTAWRELADLFLPTRWRADSDTSAHERPFLNSKLVNSAGVLAMRTMAAGMQGGMTSPVRPWFRLKVRDGGQGTPDGLHAWLDDATQAMQSVLHMSNAYNALHGLYADLGTFGTGLLVETADAEGLHFHLVRAGEYVLDVNGKGEVDTFFRRISMTARQIVDLWGEAGDVPEPIRQAAAPDRASTKRYDVIHAVFPRKDWKQDEPLSLQGKQYASVYFTAQASDAGKPAILSEGGFDMFPAFAPRWDVGAGDVYGRSPAMDVAPDCKMLQAMTVTLRRMQHKMADPPMMADSSIKKYGVRLDPSSVNFVDMNTALQGGAPIVPIQMPEPAALNFTMQGIQGVEKVVQDGLYTDLFRMLIDDDRRQVTAFEIQAKQQEKMSLIGPVVERLIKELLEPLILRTFALMQEWNALPPLPDGVELAELDVDFESVLAQAQRMTSTSAMDQGLAFLVGAAQAVPDILDILDSDAMGRAYLDRIGMPESCLRDESEIARIRQQRAEQQAAMMQQEQALAQTQQAVDMTAAAKNMGQTPTGADGQTLMGTLLGGLGAV